MKTADPTLTYPLYKEAIPEVSDRAGAYELRFAQNEDDLDRVAKLRFEVFNVELSEGLAESWRTCRDIDQFDAQCHHLMVVETETGNVVGTYRMQTAKMARAGGGFYSDNEFELDALGAPFLDRAIELGRACVALAHRNSRVLFLLWRGLARYVQHNQHRFFFGCCSLTSQDADEAWFVKQKLIRREQMHPTLRVSPRASMACFPTDYAPPDEVRDVMIPRLMRTYLDYGAKIAGDPVIDRAFKTIDFLAVFDMQAISPRVRRLFVD